MAQVKVEFLGGPDNGKVVNAGEYSFSMGVYYDGEWYKIQKRKLAYFYKKNGYAEYVVIHKERQ